MDDLTKLLDQMVQEKTFGLEAVVCREMFGQMPVAEASGYATSQSTSETTTKVEE